MAVVHHCWWNAHAQRTGGAAGVDARWRAQEHPRPGGREAALVQRRLRPPRKKPRQLWRQFYTATKNAMDPIEQLKKLNTQKLSPEEDFAMLARLTKGLGGRFQQMIKNGTYDINTGKVNGKGLDEVIKPIANDPEEFTAYALAKRVIELEGRGIKTGMSCTTRTGLQPRTPPGSSRCSATWWISKAGCSRTW